MKYVHPSGTHQAQIRNNKISEKNGKKHNANPLFFEKAFLKKPPKSEISVMCHMCATHGCLIAIQDIDIHDITSLKNEI